MKEKFDIIVVGAGPAGLMASISAAEGGAKVLVCECLDRPGCKLLATGGGKCNLTNTLSTMDFIQDFGRQGRFMLPALEAMDSKALRGFFSEHGVETVSEDGFHFFPKSERAGDILGVLLDECERLKVEMRFSTRVSELIIEEDRIRGVVTNDAPVNADKVIVATGGKGYPGLGGLGIGYKLAQQAGHSITEPVPALVGLMTKETWPHSCTGNALPDVAVSIDLPKLRKKQVRGVLLFTHNGISGPSVIDISGEVCSLLLSAKTVPLKINLLPEFTVDDWAKKFDNWQKNHGKKHIRNVLSNHLPQSVTDEVCKLAGNIGNVKCAEFNASQRRVLSDALTAMPLTIRASEGFKKAMLTRGGVALKKVNPNTLESRLVSGLFFAGEVLDLDGPCGGYNLQWAFSSGYLSGGR